MYKYVVCYFRSYVCTTSTKYYWHMKYNIQIIFGIFWFPFGTIKDIYIYIRTTKSCPSTNITYKMLSFMTPSSLPKANATKPPSSHATTVQFSRGASCRPQKFGFKKTCHGSRGRVGVEAFPVRGSNPFETYAACSSNWIISPGIGVKIKSI